MAEYMSVPAPGIGNGRIAQMDDFPDIETARLVLRVLTLGDAPAVQHHFADEDVIEFMDIKACASLEDAKEIILFHANDSGCRWGVFDKVTGCLIGTCGYHCWVQEPQAQAEMGFDLGKTHWGKGLMREALQTIIRFGFSTMRLQRIVADVHPENERSIRLMRKLCFNQESDKRDGFIRFNLVQKDWETSRAP